MIKIMKYGEVPNSEIFARSVPKTDVAGTVAEIIKNVRENGDEALFEYCEKFTIFSMSMQTMCFQTCLIPNGIIFITINYRVTFLPVTP